MMDINNQFILMEEFKASSNSKGRLLKKKKCTKEQIQKSATNEKVPKFLVNLLSNEILYSIGKYQDAKKL